MAEKRRFLDVWILESNTVYREVPFTAVVDWVQQGRLLAEDKLRPSGTKEWFSLGTMPEFVPYFPRAEPFRAEDQAEALEPVQLDFNPKRRHDDEDDDVNMIPLIDVSLVLLIFFMIIGGSAAAGMLIPTPSAEFGSDLGNRDYWIGIQSDDRGEPAAYLLGRGNDTVAEQKDLKELLQALDQNLAQQPGAVELTIHADEKLQSGYVDDLLIELGKRRHQVIQTHLGVTEKRP